MNTTTTHNQTSISTQTQLTPRKDCCHGTSLTEPCFYCAQEGTYFNRDKEVYEEIAKNTHNISFNLAFALYERINLWQQASKEVYLDTYFKEIKRRSEISWSIESLKQAYYVAKEFPHLKERTPSRLKFSIYREVASAKLTQEQKKEIIQKAEEEGLKFSKVRELKEEYQGKENRLNKSKTIIFNSQEELIENAKQFFLSRSDIKKNTKITIIIKETKNEHTEN